MSEKLVFLLISNDFDVGVFLASFDWGWGLLIIILIFLFLIRVLLPDFSNLQEYFFECGNTDSIALNPELCFLRVELIEHSGELIDFLHRELHCDLRRDIPSHFAARDMLGDEGDDGHRVHFGVFLGNRDVVPHSEFVLQENSRPSANKLTVVHDANTVAQEVGLVHEVRRQDDDSVIFVVLHHLPDVSSGGSVHSRGGLIQIDQLGTSCKCHGD